MSSAWIALVFILELGVPLFVANRLGIWPAADFHEKMNNLQEKKLRRRE